jgi:hypothetical protein
MLPVAALVAPTPAKIRGERTRHLVTQLKEPEIEERGA